MGLRCSHRQRLVSRRYLRREVQTHAVHAALGRILAPVFFGRRKFAPSFPTTPPDSAFNLETAVERCVQGKARRGGIASYSDELQRRHARQGTRSARRSAIHPQGEAERSH